jgi:hypothetical protein
MRRHRTKCYRCRTTVREMDPCETFLMPLAEFQVVSVTMHKSCLAIWNRLATSKEYGLAWEQKQKRTA